MHREISDRIARGDRCYRRILYKYLCYKDLIPILSIKLKTSLYKLSETNNYACEIWTSTKVDNEKLAIYERKVLRNILGPIYNTELRTFERRKKNDFYRLYEIPNIL